MNHRDDDFTGVVGEVGVEGLDGELWRAVVVDETDGVFREGGFDGEVTALEEEFGGEGGWNVNAVVVGVEKFKGVGVTELANLLLVPIPDFQPCVDGRSEDEGGLGLRGLGVDEFVLREAIAAEERFDGTPVNAELEGTVWKPVEEFTGLALGWRGMVQLDGGEWGWDYHMFLWL